MSNEIDSLIGTPRPDNSGGAAYETFKQKEGVQVFAILPPTKSLAESGKWAVAFALHFGWNIPGPKGKTKPRPFLCMQEKDFNTGMYKVQDAADEVIEQNKQALASRKAALEGAGWSQAQLIQDEEYKRLKGWLYSHNTSFKWHCLVMDQNGRFGIFRFTHSAYKLLKSEIERIGRDGYNAIGHWSESSQSLEGAWMVFDRPNKNGLEDKVYALTKSETDGQGRTASYIQTYQIPRDRLISAVKSLPDLNEYREQYRVSHDDVRDVVNCSGDPEEVLRILGPLGGGDAAPASTPQGASSPAVPSTAAAPPPPPAPPAATEAPPPPSNGVPPPPAQNSSVPTQGTPMAPPPPAPTPSPAAPSMVPTPPEPSPANNDPMAGDDESFQALFGTPQ